MTPMKDYAPKRYQRRPLRGDVVLYAIVALLFALGFWATSGTVSDEEIRPTAIVKGTR